MKRTTSIIAIVGFLVVMMVSCTIWRYNKTLDNQAAEWYQKFIAHDLKGLLLRINHPTEKQHEITMMIETDSLVVSLGITCVTDDILSSIFIGDSVLKARNSKTLNFCRPSMDECIKHELNFCGAFD